MENGKHIDTVGGHFTRMIGISDAEILASSKGAVFRDLDENGFGWHTLLDENIFGKLSKETLSTDYSSMGHIKLPVPVVNIHYFCGRSPVLADALKMSMTDLADIIYYKKAVVVGDELPGYQYRQLIDVNDFLSLDDSVRNSADIKIGAKAIDALLKRENVKDREYMILHCLPVLPLSMRYHTKEDDFGNVSFVPVSIEVPYRRVVHRAQRCSKLIHLEGRVALYIVLKDKQLLQEAADSLICNGAYKPPYSDMGGIPYLSLNSLNNTVGRYAGNLRISGGWDVKKILGLVAEMKELEDYIQDDPEEYSAGEHQLYNEMRDCLLVNLQSFAYRYFDTAYPEHASLAGKAIEYILDDFVPYVIGDYRYILNRSSQRMLDPDNELNVKLFEKTVLTHLESGIQDRADLYAEHRAKWDAATLGSIFG